MSIEANVLDFKLSNTFEEYEAHMNAAEQQAMFKEMGIKTFYIGKSFEYPKRAPVIFQGPKIFYLIFLKIQKQNQLLKLLSIFKKGQ